MYILNMFIYGIIILLQAKFETKAKVRDPRFGETGKDFYLSHMDGMNKDGGPRDGYDRLHHAK